MEVLTSFNLQNKRNIAKVIELLYANHIPEYILKMLLKRLIWATTENNNVGDQVKYDGQPFWSAKAIDQIIENRKNHLNWDKDIRHDHSVPKEVIIDKLNMLNAKTFQNILDIIDRYCFSVVISLDEDRDLTEKGYRSKMEAELEENNAVKNIFSRYIKCQIQICRISDNLTLKNLSESELTDIKATCRII